MSDDTIREAAAGAINEWAFIPWDECQQLSNAVLAAVTPLIEAALIERLAERFRQIPYDDDGNLLGPYDERGYLTSFDDWLRAQPEAKPDAPRGEE